MYTNKENSTKLIRISPSVKKRLEIFQAGDTPNLCIDRMITFFEITGYNPRYASKNPTALVEKRIEDLVKIVKSQERDIFKPILENAINQKSHKTYIIHSLSSSGIPEEEYRKIVNYVLEKKNAGEIDVMTWAEVYDKYGIFE